MKPFLDMLLKLVQSALEIAERWCSETDLSVNPLKTRLVIFIRKYKIDTVEESILEGIRLVVAQLVKNLGVIVDRKYKEVFV